MKLTDILLARASETTTPEVVERGRRVDRTTVLTETACYVRGLLSAGVAPGDRVVLLGTQDVRELQLLAAASALGLQVLMPYNLADAVREEWLDLVHRARPAHVLGAGIEAGLRASFARAGTPVVDVAEIDSADGAPPALADLVVADEVDEFLVLFSSGTTGVPKGISVSERLVTRRVESVSAMLGIDGDARVFMSGLINNTTGVILSFGAFLRGASLIYPHDRRVEGWPEQVARERASHVMLRPGAMAAFVTAAERGGHDLSSLRTVAYGAAAMPADLLRRARALIGSAFVQGYGLSETYGPFCWVDEAAHRVADRRTGSDAGHRIGRVDDTVVTRIDPSGAAEGELLVRSDSIMNGYWNPSTGDLESPGEWFRTGDLVECAPGGDLVLRGRIQATILTRDGHRIHPEEVEAVLAQVPGVDEAVVVGTHTQAAAAERPVACLSGSITGLDSSLARDLLLEALGRSLSREKWPDAFYLSPSPLPRNTNDKVRRNEVVAGLPADGLVPTVVPA